MKIDIFTHIIPPKYKEALLKRTDPRFYGENWDKVIDGTPALSDLDNRFRVLEKYEGLSQVLTLASSDLEESASPENAVYLPKLANDKMAELTASLAKQVEIRQDDWSSVKTITKAMSGHYNRNTLTSGLPEPVSIIPHVPSPC